MTNGQRKANRRKELREEAGTRRELPKQVRRVNVQVKNAQGQWVDAGFGILEDFTQ